MPRDLKTVPLKANVTVGGKSFPGIQNGLTLVVKSVEVS